MYSILRHRRELGAGPYEHPWGSRALQQRSLNFKERNSSLPSNWSFRPFWLSLPTCNYQLIWVRKNVSHLDQSRAIPLRGWLKGLRLLVSLGCEPDLCQAAAGSSRKRKGADRWQGGRTQGSKKQGKDVHTTYRRRASETDVWLMVLNTCAHTLPKALR